MKNFKLILNTTRHLKLRQILHRVRYEAIKKFKNKIRIKPYAYLDNVCTLDFFSKEFLREDFESFEKCKLIDFESVNKILQNEFTFLNNLSYKFVNAIEWETNPYNYRLWNFNLNYFDYLLDLSDAYNVYKREEYVLKGFELIYSWIGKNIERYDHNLWDCYVVSKRVVNWIEFYCKNSKLCKNNKLVVDAINTHAGFIYGNVEYYLDANHILMNARALVFCGAFLKNRRILNRGLEILKKEYSVQFSTDGGHYERSSSYHVEVLAHYLEITLLLTHNGYKETGDEWKKRIFPQFEYLYNIMMPNGEIPLVNDSTLDYPFKANDLVECGAILYSEPKYKKYGNVNLGLYGRRLFGKSGCEAYEKLEPIDSQDTQNTFNKDTGYMIIKDKLDGEEVYLLFDCGDGGPDYNLGHAHADALNVILTIGKNKVFVDSGVFTYKHGSERDFYRSTVAHNTICIDGQSSSNIWKSFRVAERSRTKLLKMEENEDYILIVAEHDGYTKVLKGDKIFHRRSILYIKNNGFVIIDTLYGKIHEKHNLSLQYHFGTAETKEIDENTMEVDNKIRVSLSHPYKMQKTMISEFFNIQKESLKVTINKEFVEKTDLITTVKFTNEKFEVKKLNQDSVIVNCHKNIVYNLKNQEVKIGEPL